MELVYGSASYSDPFCNTAVCNLNRLFQVIDVRVTSLFCSSKLIHRRQFITWFRNSLSAEVNSNCVCCVSDQVQKKLESLQRCQSLEEVNYFQ